MNANEKAHAIREFFLAPEPQRDRTAIAIGITVAVVGLFIATKSASAAFGLTVVVAGALWALLLPMGIKRVDDEPENETQFFSVVRYPGAKTRFEARPSYPQVLQWLKEGLTVLDEKSRTDLGLMDDDLAGDPIRLIGPCSESDAPGFRPEDVLRRKVNGRYFYSTYHVVVFHFVEQFLGSFRGNYNLIKNVTTSEQTDEVFYHHVAKVQVTADTTNYSLAPGEALEHAKTFKLGIANGEDISVRINDQQVKATEEIISLGDNAVANIRAMLRRYKDLPATA